MENNHISESYYLFGSQAILARLKALTAEINGVKQNLPDIEYIHRMRVASRRLRRSLSVFEECFPKKIIKLWKSRIRKVTKTLGSARDMDVQIAFLENFIKNINDKSHVRGINRLLLRIKQQRKKEQKKIFVVLNNIENENLLSNMENFLRQNIIQLKLNSIDEHSSYVFQKAFDRVLFLLEDMISFEIYIYEPARIEELHSMRISSKFLRYEMEIFSELYEKELNPFIKKVKTIQTILGSIHDSDVWISFIPEFIDDEKIFFEDFYGHIRGFSNIVKGLNHLFEDRKKARIKDYKKFLIFWESAKKNELWLKLKKTLKDYYDKNYNIELEKIKATEELKKNSEAVNEIDKNDLTNIDDVRNE